jgi:tripartite-type tricarboxylate transporter receptor subunit TctC
MMRIAHTRSVFAVLSLATGLAVAPAVQAQAPAFPSKPISIVVGFTPGGGTDITARVLAQRLTADLGQSVVVSNKSGAAGAIAAGEVARAPADGHTVLMIASATIAALALNANVNFSLEKDLTAVAQVTNAPMVMLLHPGVPASDVKQLIAYARANPGALSFGSTGVGSGSHLAGELFGSMTNTKLVHVPFKSGGDSVMSTVSGQIQMNFPSLPAAQPMMKAGKLKAFAVTTLKRSALLPDLPALDELGLTGYDLPTWYGLVAPAAVPRPIINQLHAATVKAMGTAEAKAAITKLGMDTQVNTPEQFAAYMRSQMASISKLGQASGIKFVE